VTAFELLLPRIKQPELVDQWSSDWKFEFRSWFTEGFAFIVSIGFLMMLDVWSASESWIPLPISLLFDVILLLVILVYLFQPKSFGFSNDGMYLNGWLINWNAIEECQDRGEAIILKTMGVFREHKRVPLPGPPEKNSEILQEIEKHLEKKK